MTGDETAAVVARIERCAETCESKGDECAPGSHDNERQHAPPNSTTRPPWS
jgi:hypothetical protein